MRHITTTLRLSLTLNAFTQIKSEIASLIPIRKGTLWGYCATNKVMKIAAQFQSADAFNNGVAIIYEYKDSSVKLGLIDTTGKIIVKPEYDQIFTTDSSRTYIKKGEKTIIREKSGDFFIPEKYILDHVFSEGLYVVKRNGLEGVIDKNEIVIIPFNYKAIGQIDEKGFAIITDKRRREGFINKNGETLFRFKKRKYHISSFFSDDLVSVMKKDKHGLYKCGFINRQGKIVIQPAYRTTNDFSKGYCGVNDGNRSGFINKKGDTIVPFKYAGTGYFRNGYGDFEIMERCGFVDTSGKEVLNVKGSHLYYVNSNFIIVHHVIGIMGESFSLIDIYGNEILPNKYSLIGIPKNGIFYVSEGDKYYYMDIRLRKYIDD